ncbi:3D domain-containing protein [Brevibacillus daliensis]|uniref:3D domain-containing protein n=1 Tax=Brevibacillus daliensis TaxID=2892995 RepID=UPI001E623A1D|nr:3D domain-containing protein [Brevibacillus daliensis]
MTLFSAIVSVLLLATIPQPQEPPVLVEQYEVTAYTLSPHETGKTASHPEYGITASGAKVAELTTVACPPELPFGTRVYIEGVGERMCQDRGGAIKGRKLDVYMHDYNDAIHFGRQTLGVTIIKNSEGDR